MKFVAFVIAFAFLSCTKIDSLNPAQKQKKSNEIRNENSEKNLVHASGNTIKTRINAPDGYQWIYSDEGSFDAYLENFPVLRADAKILRFDGIPIATQNLHAAIYDIDVGEEDLQQCADAVIRLRAEFLKKSGRENEIAFHYTSGHLLKWSDFKNSHRLIVEGNNVSPAIISAVDASTNSFQNYLKNVFMYAGTISMNKETKPINDNKDLKTGDILITAGSPGHVVFIAGVSKNAQGEKLYLLGQGFTPAQSIHVIRNPFDKTISPWYKLDVNASEIKTARYDFSPVNFRRY